MSVIVNGIVSAEKFSYRASMRVFLLSFVTFRSGGKVIRPCVLLGRKVARFGVESLHATLCFS